MRILQLGKFYPIRGGVEKVMYDLMVGLSDRGVRCDMMCAESFGKGSVRDTGAGSKVLSFHTWAKVASTTIAPSMIQALRAQAHLYDLIHVHHPDPMAAIALRLSGYNGPVVLHWHADIIKSKPLLSFYEPLQDWLLRRADVVVTTSPQIKDDSKPLRRYSAKVKCIPIGIAGMEADAGGAAVLRRRLGDRKIVFSLGRLVPYKGYQHLISAAAHLPQDYVVVIGGEGPLRGQLEQQRDAMGLADRVIFTGRIDDELLPAYFTACDMFCLPSVLKTEAFGIVQIEAMSLGKPVVATILKGSGTAWVNRHNVSGLNVEPGQPRKLAEAIRAIGDSEAEARRLGVGAKLRFMSEFTLGLMVDRCYGLYKDLIEKNKNSNGN